MRLRSKLVTIALAIAMVAWIAAALSRRARVRAEALSQAELNFPNPDVRVPLLPLLVNPFRSHAKAYLFQDDMAVAEIETGK